MAHRDIRPPVKRVLVREPTTRYVYLRLYYYLPSSRDKVINKAVAYVLNELLGPDVDPWPMIEEV